MIFFIFYYSSSALLIRLLLPLCSRSRAILFLSFRLALVFVTAFVSVASQRILHINSIYQGMLPSPPLRLSFAMKSLRNQFSPHAALGEGFLARHVEPSVKNMKLSSISRSCP
jgi:hypothetical protein